MMMRAIAMLLLALSTAPATDASSRGVPPGYRQVAQEFGIPPSIFYAMALVESGRRVGDSSQLHPWPWTLNIRGTAQYFDQRRTAERALSAALRDGEEFVDVGLMQVNWHFHQGHLKSPKAALDPYRNLRAAAAILRGCRRVHEDWWSAVGCYHAPADPARAQAYRMRVSRHWRRLTGEG